MDSALKMESAYQPKLAVGVKHVPANIPLVQRLLDDKITEGIKVGTEAYSHPLTHPEYWEKGAPEFFDAINDFVKSKGGFYVPLQRLEDFKRIKAIETDPALKGQREDLRQKLRKACQEGGFRLEEDDPMWADHMMEYYGLCNRILQPAFLQQGVNLAELRDDTLVELTRESQPDLIVVGWQHLPPLMVHYPQMPIAIVGRPDEYYD